MGDTDDTSKLIVLAGMGLGALLFFVGGLLTQAAGRWRDGDRVVELHQFGPWVWGAATFTGGEQTYRGLASFGRLWLKRRDVGDVHLRSLGFTAAQVPYLGGQVTANLSLRCGADGLNGAFFGRKFSFDDKGIRAVTLVAPVARLWRREAQPHQVASRQRP